MPLHMNMHKRFKHKDATLEHTKPVTSDPHKVEHNSHNKRITHTVTTTTVATNNPPKMCTVVTTTRSHTQWSHTTTSYWNFLG